MATESWKIWKESRGLNRILSYCTRMKNQKLAIAFVIVVYQHQERIKRELRTVHGSEIVTAPLLYTHKLQTRGGWDVWTTRGMF